MTENFAQGIPMLVRIKLYKLKLHQMHIVTNKQSTLIKLKVIQHNLIVRHHSIIQIRQR